MLSRSARKVMVVIGAALAGAACTPAPQWGDQVVAPVAGASAYAIDITGASVVPVTSGNVTTNRVLVLYSVTADGSPASLNQLTAAHRTLPFGTRVLVTNLRNGRSVEVRINDRGPHVADRIIDLSFAAAQALDSSSVGTIPVRIQVLALPPR